MDTTSLMTYSAEETQAFGRLLGAACRGGETILLEGDLGAGKTTLTGGLAAGLNVAGPVVSPTFIVLREYEGRVPLYHFDLYRLEGGGHGADLEFGDYLNGDGVCVIEWPAHAPELLPQTYLHIKLMATGEDMRELRCTAVGDAYAALLEEAMGAIRTP